jgi:YHS domain-containing protein
MKKLAFLTAAALVAMVMTSVLHAEDTKPTKPEAAPKKLHAQTDCPVMGGEIDSSYYTDIQGQRVYHCCPACSAKLKADPDKYFKKAAAEGVLFENIQKYCPVDGMAINKEHFTDYEGRRVFFCSATCESAFAKDPQTYLKKLDSLSEPKTTKGTDTK